MQAAVRAETFRGAPDLEPLPEQGPAELVSLARNFNTMARDISALLANRTTLLSGVSHDLRTPITRMRLAVELLPEDVDSGLKQRLERNLLSMDRLIQDALQFARGTAEPAQLIDLDALLQDILAGIGGETDSVPLVVTQAPGAPVAVAPGALRRVLHNLVDNALTHAGEAKVELDGLTIRVLDNGPGSPLEYQDKIFEPFFRLDSSRSASTGVSGLGLAIVSQLCQAHGWQIASEHRRTGARGLQSCFTLTLGSSV